MIDRSDVGRVGRHRSRSAKTDTAVIADTDNGLYDRDRTWDRAVGPFQFIPTSWAIFGKDGNGDGFADPNNIYDAVPAAVAHLCPSGSIDNLEAAIFGYNHSNAYVADVLEWADTYPAPEGVVAAGDYAYPLPAAYATAALAGRSHHDYPAWDAGTPLGTPIFAMTTGTVITAHGTAGRFPADSNRCGNTVTIAGIDGAVYTYCHLSSVSVSVGQTVLRRVSHCRHTVERETRCLAKHLRLNAGSSSTSSSKRAGSNRRHWRVTPRSCDGIRTRRPGNSADIALFGDASTFPAFPDRDPTRRSPSNASDAFDAY